MILTVVSAKGGVGKTTTAVCLAAVLNEHAPTILFDQDSTKIATLWSERGKGFSFPVEPGEAGPMLAHRYKHNVIDSGQAPSLKGLAAAAKFSQLLVLPAPPNALDIDGLVQTIKGLREVGATNYRVLLTKVSPDARKMAEHLRDVLAMYDAPTFTAEIPRFKAFEKAAEQGCLVADVDDRNAARAWAAFKAVGEELREWL